jgi:hypothetical protein
LVVSKEELIKLMKDTIESNWFDPNMVQIDAYERGITVISGGLSPEDTHIYDGKEDDIDRIIKYMNEYPDLIIENVYQIIHLYRPWNFMKYSKF